MHLTGLMSVALTYVYINNNNIIIVILYVIHDIVYPVVLVVSGDSAVCLFFPSLLPPQLPLSSPCATMW